MIHKEVKMNNISKLIAIVLFASSCACAPVQQTEKQTLTEFKTLHNKTRYVQYRGECKRQTYSTDIYGKIYIEEEMVMPFEHCQYGYMICFKPVSYLQYQGAVKHNVSYLMHLLNKKGG